MGNIVLCSDTGSFFRVQGFHISSYVLITDLSDFKHFLLPKSDVETQRDDILIISRQIY